MGRRRGEPAASARRRGDARRPRSRLRHDARRAHAVAAADRPAAARRPPPPPRTDSAPVAEPVEAAEPDGAMNFPPDHPLTERVRGICMAYPEAAEVIAHGRCTFRAGKRQFAIVGAAHDESARSCSSPTTRSASRSSSGTTCSSLPYEGAYGWLAIRVDADTGDWDFSRNCSTRRTAGRAAAAAASSRRRRACGIPPRFALSAGVGYSGRWFARERKPCARSSMDRASDYGSEGWGFESLRAHTVLRQ